MSNVLNTKYCQKQYHQLSPVPVLGQHIIFILYFVVPWIFDAKQLAKHFLTTSCLSLSCSNLMPQNLLVCQIISFESLR